MAPTTQITVRLPADLVDWLDEQVAGGRYESRATAVAKLLRRHRRALQAEADVDKILAAGPDPDRASIDAWLQSQELAGPDPETPTTQTYVIGVGGFDSNGNPDFLRAISRSDPALSQFDPALLSRMIVEAPSFPQNDEGLAAAWRTVQPSPAVQRAIEALNKAIKAEGVDSAVPVSR